jgi:hypothetical protein
LGGSSALMDLKKENPVNVIDFGFNKATVANATPPVESIDFLLDSI